MSFTIDRSNFSSAIQTHPLKQFSDAKLAKLASNNEEAKNLLILRNMNAVEQAAIYVVIKYGLKEPTEEFESIAVTKLLAPEIWKEEISNVPGYIFRVSKNAIIDELRKDIRQRKFINQFNETSSMDKSKTLEEYLLDPLANDLNRNIRMFELEEELIKSIPLVYKTGGNQNLVQQIVELSYGINLGTNPSCKKLKGQEIADKLGINFGTMKTIKFMFNKVVRKRLLEKAA